MSRIPLADMATRGLLQSSQRLNRSFPRGMQVKIDLDKSGRAQSVDLKTYVDVRRAPLLLP